VLHLAHPVKPIVLVSALASLQIPITVEPAALTVRLDSIAAVVNASAHPASHSAQALVSVSPLIPTTVVPVAQNAPLVRRATMALAS
jgi:hypothetical protein